jgi:signal transduction histidine kinase
MERFKALQLGVYEGLPIEKRRHVIFSNAVYWVVAILLAIYFLIRISITRNGINSFTGWIPIHITILAGISLLLNWKKQYLTSRVIFMAGWILLIVVVPVVVNGPGQSSYFQHAYFSILFSPVVHLFFSNRTERFFYFFFLMVFLGFTVFSVDFLLAFDRSPNPQVPILKSTLGMRINHVIFWLFLNLLMVYVLRINNILYAALQRRNDLIDKQNQELNEQRQKLRDQNIELEKRVALRTLSLQEQNQKLTEYAFMHAHVLRAPISRIRGLINLLRHTNDPDEDLRVRNLMEKSMHELDEATRSITDKLESQDEAV